MHMKPYYKNEVKELFVTKLTNISRAEIGKIIVKKVADGSKYFAGMSNLRGLGVLLWNMN